MVVTEMDGTPFDGVDRPLELISAEDLYSGPRYVRRLCNIELVMLS